MEANWLDQQLEADNGMQEGQEAAEEVEVQPDVQPKAEVQPEVSEKPEVQPEEEKDDDRQVPLYSLMRERDRRKAAEAEKAATDKAIAELKAQIESLRAPPKPDRDEDPVGYLENQTQELRNELSKVKEESQKTVKEREFERQRNEVQGYISAAEKDFQESNPDYQDALIHMRTKQIEHLVTNEGLMPEEAMNKVFQAEFQEAVNLLAMGYNPAEMAYLKASKQFKYAPKPKVEKVPEDTEAREKLENLDKALQAAKGGGNKGGSVDLKKMLDAPDTEFEAIWQDTFGKARY